VQVNETFYGGRAVIQTKTELWNAIRVLLEELTGEEFKVQDIRKTYKLWRKSTFIKSMSFGEFVMMTYWGEPIDG
jgi:hypothetical protein